jgi:hypothetical protein
MMKVEDEARYGGKVLLSRVMNAGQILAQALNQKCRRERRDTQDTDGNGAKAGPPQSQQAVRLNHEK